MADRLPNRSSDDFEAPRHVAIMDTELQHDPEKWVPVFGKRSCSDNGLERDDDSKKSHPALEAAIAEFRRRERRFGGPAVRTGS
jgi:hypothetical protein